jgi:hypothetical protein
VGLSENCKEFVTAFFKRPHKQTVYKSSLKESMYQCIYKEVEKECIKICSRKDISVLRKCSSDHLATFSLNTLNAEIQT